MKTILLLAIFVGTLSPLIAQLDLVDNKTIYDQYYFDNGEKCFAFSETTESVLIDSFVLKNHHLELNVLRNQSGVSNFLINESGLYLPYVLTDGTRYYDHLKLSLTQDELKNFFARIDFIPSHLIDTIQIIRKKASGMWQSKTDAHGTPVNCLLNTPIEFIELRLLKSNLEGSQAYTNGNINTKIEFREGDLVARHLKRQVICPEKVDSKLIVQINKRLIKLGHLDKKRRTSYYPEVKNALIQFQIDQKIPSGYIDAVTLKKLDILFFST